MTKVKSQSITNQYDNLFRNMSKGLIITVNGSTVGQETSPELHVKECSNEKTDVLLEDVKSNEYRIYRDSDNDIILSKITTVGYKFECKVITLEIVGLRD